MRKLRKGALLFAAALIQFIPTRSDAKSPFGPVVFCQTYPTAPVCDSGLPNCTQCHTSQPTRNVYGIDVEAWLLPGEPRPLENADFEAGLPAALLAVENFDSDGDGYTNLEEILAGTHPADSSVFPDPDESLCDPGAYNPAYDVCAKFDAPYAFKKVVLNFCGRTPTFEEMESFRGLDEAARLSFLDTQLDICIQTNFWRGKDGVVWQIFHPKVRPVGAFKAGEDAGTLPFSDYYNDYALGVFTQIDGRDARDVLLADYFVDRTETAGTTQYLIVQDESTLVISQNCQVERRVGLITTQWSLLYRVMFTALGRGAAAHAYRAFLGYDIAKMEGLHPVANEPVDYDLKGVDAPACAACHSTLDPLTYPFRNYHGLGKYAQRYQYIPNRLAAWESEVPGINNTPEAGMLLGQPVNDLNEWGQVAANSDAFARNTVRDYWKAVFGREHTDKEREEFDVLWQDFKGHYSVDKILHDLIHTEAFGAP